jgi:phosphoglycerol transferase MdoB-like AlkP superfamily enzyme
VLKYLAPCEEQLSTSAFPITKAERAAPWRQLYRDLGLWVALVLLLQLFRAALLLLFKSQLSAESGFEEIITCFITGLRFDIQVATYAVVPSLLLTAFSFLFNVTVWSRRVYNLVTALSVMLCAIAFIADAAFFAEYNDQFNQWIFGLIYDDRAAIFQTIWKTYPIVWMTIGGIIGTVAIIRFLQFSIRLISEKFPTPTIPFPAAILFIAAFIIFGARGSFGRRPMQLKDAARSGDAFLNKLVLNPFSSLKYAIQQQRKLQAGSGLEIFLPDKDIGAAAREFFQKPKNPATIDECIERVASGNSVNADHIFLIVMESYDAWPLEDRFAPWALTTNLKRLQSKGISAKAFLSAGGGTMPSLTSIISGLPNSETPMNYQPLLRNGSPAAIAPIFKRLGYRTRFFYGGYLSWQRLGDFCREQGFEEVFGGDLMSAKITGNEWGVDDEVLFNFVREKTGTTPTFNVIMTTSYHPPYSLDLRAKGFLETPITSSELGKKITPREIQMYGHLWYADRELGKFVDAMEQREARPIFAITGDHYSRRFPSFLKPTVYETKAVPFVLYGPKALGDLTPPSTIVGDHMDVAPTLIELSAPSGFRFKSFGKNLLSADAPQIAYGNWGIIATNIIVPFPVTDWAEDIQGRSVHAPEVVSALKQKYNQLHALAWWRVMRGDALIETPSKVAIAR